MGYLHNVHHPLMDKYFDFGEMIIAVNCIHTDFEDRNNGLIMGRFYGNIVQKRFGE
jgi:hypothetical protein